MRLVRSFAWIKYFVGVVKNTALQLRQMIWSTRADTSLTSWTIIRLVAPVQRMMCTFRSSSHIADYGDSNFDSERQESVRWSMLYQVMTMTTTTSTMGLHERPSRRMWVQLPSMPMTVMLTTGIEWHMKVELPFFQTASRGLIRGRS